MYKRTTLDNGVRVLTERMESVRSVSVGIWVDAGSRDETWDQAGYSHLVEHMIFKGTERRSALDIALEMDAIGGLANAFTSREQTCFHAKVLDYHLPDVVDLLSDICLNSKFDPGELTREQGVIVQEIKMVDDTPDEHVHVILPQVIWPDHPLGRSILGREDSVTGAGPDDLKTYLKQAYQPNRIVVAATGNLDHDRFVELVRPAFAALAPTNGLRKRTDPAPDVSQVIKSKPLEQTHICLALPGFSAVDDQRFPTALLNSALGGSMSSRLFQEVREKRGLAYSVYSYIAAYSTIGFVGVYLGVAPEMASKALGVVMEVLAEVKASGLGSDELAKAKEHLKGSILLSAESTDNRMNRLARNEFNFGRLVDLDEVAQRIDQVTEADVIRAAGEIIDPTKCCLAALGPDVDQTIGPDWRNAWPA